MRPTAKITNWEKVFIFISSTFNDMHAERDYLVKNVFPELSEWCERRKLRMVDIDLRWGVTEADATQNKNVVKVCLNRIDECRPFFLCFLGQRYGWVPERKDVSIETFEKFPGLEETMNRGASVTELEILHSLISPFHSGHTVENKKYHPSEFSFFYFRDEAYIKDLPKDLPYLRRIYSDLEEEDVPTRDTLQKKREALKRQIEDTQRPCHIYHTRWSVDQKTPEIAMPLQCPATIAENQKRWRRDWLKYADVHVSNLDVEEEPAEAVKAREFNDNLNTGRLIDFRSETRELSDLVVEELKVAIEARFPHHKEREDPDELQREIDQQEQFVFINSEGFIKRSGDFDELDEYVESSSNNVFVLTAGAGMGKSTLLANWVDNYRTAFQDEPGHSIHFRFIGASDGSTNVYSLLRLLLKEIKEVSDKLSDEIPDDPQKLRSDLPDLLETIGKNGKTVIVLDALNQLETGLSDLTWLPRSLSEGIKLIVSFKREEGDAEDLYINFSKDERVHLAEVKPFEERKDRRRLIDAYLSQFLKKLDERHIESLIDSGAARNPLYLKVVLSELRVFGAFANLGEKIRSEFGDTPLSAFEAVLQRLEQDPAYSPIDPQKAVSLIFGLIAHARHGLSAEELTSLLIQALDMKDNEDNRAAASETIYLYLRQVRSFLARRDRRYDFFYESFKQAALKKYTSEEEKLPKRKVQSWHKLIADYFYGLTLPNLRKLSELPFQQTYSKMWIELYSTLTDTEFLEQKNTQFTVYHLLDDYRTALGMMPKEGEVGKQCSVLQAFCKALDQASFVLKDNPELTFPQLYNRLQLGFDNNVILKTRLESEKNRFDQPWLRLITQPAGKSVLIRTFSGHKAGVASCAISPDDLQIASASADGTLKVWDLAKGKELLTLRGYGGYVNDCAFSPDGERIVSACSERTLKLWNAETGEELRILEGHEDKVTACAYSPDGRVIMSTSDDLSTRLWDARSGQQLIMLRDLDGERIAKERRASTRPISNNMVGVYGHFPSIKACAFSPCGHRFVSGWHDKTLKVWETATGAEVASFSGHKPVPRSDGVETSWSLDTCAFSPDGRCIVSSGGGSLKVWDAASGEEIKILKKGGLGIPTSAFSPDGRYLLSGGQQLDVWDVESWGLIKSIKAHTGPVWDCSFSHNGQFIITGSNDKTVKLWDAKATISSETHKGHRGVVDTCTFSTDGRRIISASSDWQDDSFTVWDAETGEKLFTRKAGTQGVCDCIFDFECKHIVTGCWDGTVKFWDAQSGREIESSQAHSGSVSCCKLSPNGQYVVTVGGDTIILWDINTGKHWMTLKGHKGLVTNCAFSPDGSRLISASLDFTLKLWEVKVGQELATLRGHPSQVNQCYFSPDGRLIVSKSPGSQFSDTQIRLWDAVTGDTLAVVDERGSYGLLGFSPDGRYVVSYLSNIDPGCIKLRDARTLEERGIIKVDIGKFSTYCISPNGQYLVAVCGNAIKLWDIGSREVKMTLIGFFEGACSSVFSPDNKRIAVGDGAGQVLIFSIENIEILPVVVTPYIQSGKLLYRCKYCREKNKIEKSSLGQEANCSSCSETVKLNPFIVNLEKFIKKTEIKSESADVHFNVGFKHWNNGNIEEAIKEYKEAIRIEPDYVDAYYFLGQAYWRRGQESEAMVEWNQVIKCQKNHSGAHYQLALAYSKQGSNYKAGKFYKRALELGYKAPKGHTKDLYEKKIDIFPLTSEKKQIQFRSKHQNKLGVKCLKKGLKDKAILHFKESIRIDPNFDLPHINLGICYANEEKFQKAIIEYTEAIRLEPNNADAHYYMGEAYIWINSFRKALVEYEKAILIDKNHANSHNMIGILLLKMKNFDKAINHFERAVELGHKKANANLDIALKTQNSPLNKIASLFKRRPK